MELGSVIVMVAQQNKQGFEETKRRSNMISITIALRTQVNLLNSILFSVSPKWVL